MAPKRQGKLIKCDNCGKEIYRPLSSIKAANYCSVQCRSAKQRGIDNPNGKQRALIACQRCGKLFEVLPSKVGKRRYCSQACAGVAKVDYVPVQCHWCGKELLRQPSWANRDQRHFCDNTCRGAWQSTQTGEDAPAHKEGTTVQVECSQCGKRIERDRWKIERNDHFFCGADCWDEWRKIHMRGDANPNWKEPVKTKCATCGTPIERDQARVGTESRKVHFCCKACKYKWMGEFLSGPTSPHWKGGHIKYYGPNWPEQQRLARSRDKHTCQVCGRTRKQNGKELDVHHVVPFKSFNYIPGENENYLQANELTNLVCLCMRCHRKVERGKLPLQPRLV
mgnify:FL=1